MSKLWTSCKQVINKSWTGHEQIMNKLWTSHEQVDRPFMKKLWTSCKHVMNKSRSSHDKSREVMNKLRTSWELAEALKDLKTTSLGVGWVVHNYTDIKAISAPSWGLGLGLGWAWQYEIFPPLRRFQLIYCYEFQFLLWLIISN